MADQELIGSVVTDGGRMPPTMLSAIGSLVRQGLMRDCRYFAMKDDSGWNFPESRDFVLSHIELGLAGLRLIKAHQCNNSEH